MYQRQTEAEALQSRYALRVASRLSERAAMTEHHVDERLRVARERALDRALQRRAAAASSVVSVGVASGAGALALGGGRDDAPSASWWTRLGVLLPLIALVAGLLLIQYQHARLRAAAVAEIDVDLLVDELPPRAYSDPGFVEFLKSAQQ
ncbi:MAG: DUF3619 family protein [Ideonella sp.]|nr:DUF3619 family protein [Ideonella sp.]